MPGFAVPLDLIIFLLAARIGALVAGLAGFAFGPNRIGNLAARIAPAASAVLIAGFANS